MSRLASANGWRGYIFSRPFDGSFVPQRVQNLMIRTYAESNGLHFLLSATEYAPAGCFMMLEALLQDELPSLEGLIFYSVQMLPSKAQQRERIYKTVMGAGKGLRFALEDLVITNPAEASFVEDLFQLRDLTAHTFIGEMK